MKRITLSLLLALLLAPALAPAATLVGGGTITAPSVWKISGGSNDSKLVIGVLGVDSAGCVTCGATVNCTNCGGSGAGTVSVTVTNTAPVSVTASPVFNPFSFTTYVWSTATAAVHNLTTVAGASVRCTVCYGPSFGGAGIRVGWGTSATAPSDIPNTSTISR